MHQHLIASHLSLSHGITPGELDLALVAAIVVAVLAAGWCVRTISRLK